MDIAKVFGREPDRVYNYAGIDIYHFLLEKGESIRRTDTTSGKRIHGPADVEVRRYPDRGIDTRVLDRGSLK